MLLKRFMPLALAFAVAIPAHSYSNDPIAIGDPNSDNGGGFGNAGRGPAATPPEAPAAHSAPASREKVRPNLPEDLKPIETLVNKARHLIMNDCRTQMRVIAHSEDAFFHKLKDDPALTTDFEHYKEIYSESSGLNHLLVGESTILNTLDAWLDSIDNGTPKIARSELESVRSEVSDMEPAFFLKEEFYAENAKDPKDAAGNKKFKEHFSRMEKLASEFSAQEPEKAAEWVGNGENINAQSHLKFLALLRKAGVPTAQASRALMEYVERAGWVSPGK